MTKQPAVTAESSETAKYQTAQPASPSLTLEDEADLAERNGIPKWMFYHELAIHRREAAVRAFLNAVPDMLFLIGRDGTFLNFKASKDLEWLAPASKFLRKKVHEVLPVTVAQQTLWHIERAFLTGEMQVFEYQLPINAQVHDYEVRVLPVTPETVLAITHDRTEHKQALDQLQALSRRLLEVQEEDRRAIARELHDEIGQNLTGVALMLEQITAQTAETTRPKLDQARALIQSLIDRVRNLARDLRPAVLDDIGLLPALVTLAERYRAQTGIHVSVFAQGCDRRFAPEVETAAYRIVQEALTNVARHAQVERASVRLWAEGQVLRVEITDHGLGFDLDYVSGADVTYGVDEMRERAKLLGGQLIIRTARSRGTQVMAELPIDASSERS